MNRGRWAKVLPPLVLFAVALACYGSALGRYFTSEDFLLVRFLGENPPWRDLPAQLASPWLGIGVVKFYRPVATLLYGLEIAAFGGRPFGYNLVHLLVHALNALLVWRIGRGLALRLPRPAEPVAPLAAALLFAIHPLHPNAVVFGASFATLFGTAFLLAAFRGYQLFRERGSLPAWGLALALYVLALGSYEAAAVLPALLAAYDHGVRIGGRRHRSLFWGYLPFLAVLGLYMLLRRRIFGVFIGGYDEYSRNLLAPRLGQLAHDLATSIHQLHFPLYEGWPGPGVLALSCALLVGAPLALWGWLGRRSPDAGHARPWLFAWIWVLAALAPFAFRPPVPGNGRYAYLAAAGVALSLGFLARAVAASTQGLRRALPWAALLMFAAWWGLLLAGYLRVYIAAGRTARTIQGELIRAQRSAGSPPRIFFAGHPDFLVNESQVPVAAVFHYGLYDSVHPPFVQARVPVYPLPPLRGRELLPVALGTPESGLFEWDAVTGTARQAAVDGPAPRPAELRVIGPPGGSRIDPVRGAVAVALTPRAGERVRLIVVSRGNATVVEVDSAGERKGILKVGLPGEFLRTMDRLYGGEHYWWLEVRDAAGFLSAFTRMRSFRLAG